VTNDVFGDGVNIASRLQGLAEPDTICISHVVYQEVEKKLSLGTVVSLGQPKLKNIAQRQPVYALVKEEGPEHRKTFTVEVRLPEPEVDSFVARAQGPTKKRAEQEAARQVLEHLSISPEWLRARAEKDL